MNKNFAWKLALIFGTLLVFLFGIFGIPRSFSKQGLAEGHDVVLRGRCPVCQPA